MKLHFEPDLDYQWAAIESVCDLFRGQEICRTEFTVTTQAPPPEGAQGTLAFAEVSNLGLGNRLKLLDEDLLANLHAVQLRNGLRRTEKLASGDFTVEMETGTGKTYVYLRTVFELHKRYGFTKFVVVVPSVAIKEGVYKTLQITEDHFRGLYGGVPVEYFLYDSGKLGQVRNFATSPHIQVMVMTVGAINKKDVNNLYKDSEKTGGEKPIDLIRQTRPIIIVDEPQSVDGGLEGRGKQALSEMHPLCTLRYSATHATQHHMVYRLDAVDAYQRKLVKQIEVAAMEVQEAHNKPYVRLLAVRSTGGRVAAQVEIDVQLIGSVKRDIRWVQDGDDLAQETGRAVYANHAIGEIRTGRGQELLELRLPGDVRFLQLGEAYGDVAADGLKRLMIRRTIKEHLDKELRLRPLGIKVLSLFFIDAVERYRTYDEAGQVQKGAYARLFEEEYARAARQPDYRTLFGEVDLTAEAAEVHDGYFSIDKKGTWQDTAESNQGGRDNAERAYNLIMRDKERLLSFGTKLKFIFSHSALREGWDNPNVFQICALREMGTERERRQTIGRGLRLCVNQDGERQRGFDLNTLTVVATESYQSFADNLQKEIEKDTGIRFGVVEEHQFATIVVADAATGEVQALGFDESKALWQALRATGYVDAKGNVQDALRTALKEQKLVLPPAYEAHREAVQQILRKLAGKLEIKNSDERKPVKLRKEKLLSPEFTALWDRIKHQTTYRVSFDPQQLVEQCTEALTKAPAIIKARVVTRKADLAIGAGGVEATEKKGSESTTLDERASELPDILTELQDRTQLTRQSLVAILRGSQRLRDFERNPQQFIDLASEAINRAKRMALVGKIKYQRLGASEYYAQELFEQQELRGYLKNTLPATKSLYEKVVFDSTGIERAFAQELEYNDAVKLYVKLPGWFTVPTPLGTYNPDWAVLIETDGAERLYFVVETKGSLFKDDLRGTEGAKIECGRAHFRALAEATAVGEPQIRYEVADSFEDFIGRVG